MRPSDVSGDAEAESRSPGVPATRAFHAIERLEDPVECARWYAGTAVAYSNGQRVGPVVDRNLRSLPVEDSVVDQIRKAALEQSGFGGQRSGSKFRARPEGRAYDSPPAYDSRQSRGPDVRSGVPLRRRRPSPVA